MHACSSFRQKYMEKQILCFLNRVEIYYYFFGLQTIISILIENVIIIK